MSLEPGDPCTEVFKQASDRLRWELPREVLAVVWRGPEGSLRLQPEATATAR